MDRIYMNIQTAVMALSSFGAQPRHARTYCMNRAKRIYCYVKNMMKHFKVRLCTDKPPEYSNIPDIQDYHDWRDTAYKHHQEELPTNVLPPLGRRVIITHYYNASLMHDVLSGKAVTGILYVYNKTPIDSYSNLRNKKKQQRLLHTVWSLYPVELVSSIHQSLKISTIFRNPGSREGYHVRR